MYDQYGNKLIRRAIPYQLYDIAGLQQWFEEMSAKGWILDGFGIRTAVFHQDKPAPGVRYRLEPQSYWDTSIDYEKNEAYAQMGWEFVDTVTRYYYIYRAADPETEELHTDPVTQSYVFDHYLKYFFRFFCAGVVILLGQAAYTLGFDRSALTLSLSGFLEDLVLDTQYIVPLLLADLWALLVITPIYYFRFLKIWKLRNQLAAGVPLDAGQRYPRSTASTVAFFAVPVVLFFLSFLGILLPPSEKASLTPDQPTPAPLVSLYDLELNPAIQDPGIPLQSGGDLLLPSGCQADPEPVDRLGGAGRPNRLHLRLLCGRGLPHLRRVGAGQLEAHRRGGERHFLAGGQPPRPGPPVYPHPGPGGPVFLHRRKPHRHGQSVCRHVFLAGPGGGPGVPPDGARRRPAGEGPGPAAGADGYRAVIYLSPFQRN